MQIGERIVIDGQDYWLEGILSTGAGNYGQVWAATSAGGLAVALKFINTDAMLQADPSLHGHWRAHLEREVVFLQDLKADQSRHIVKLIQAGTVNNQPVLVLERMSGNLDQWLTQRRRDGAPLPDLAWILDWAEQILSGLDVIHQNGFVYRDLKFSNLLVDEDGALLKLADFGSIKREDGDNTRSFIGTPATMAPEQILPVHLGAEGYEYRVDYHADYYALGLLLFTLLTGRPTTAAQRRLSQLLTRHGQEGASQHREQLGGLDDEERVLLRQAIEFWTVPLSITPDGGTAAQLTHLIDGLLARDPAKRPHDSAAIRKVLDAARAGQPILPVVAPTPPLPATLADSGLPPPPISPRHHHAHRADPTARGTWSRRRTAGLISVLGLAGAMAWAIIQQPSVPRQDQADSLQAVIAPSAPIAAPVTPTPAPEPPATPTVATQPTPVAPEPAAQDPASAATNAAIAPAAVETPPAPASVADTPAPGDDDGADTPTVVAKPPTRTAPAVVETPPAPVRKAPNRATPAPGDDDGADTPTVAAKPPARTAPAVVETPPAPVRKAPNRRTAKVTPPPVVETPAPDQGEDEDESDAPAVVAKPPERAPAPVRSAPPRKAAQSQNTAKAAPPPATEPATAPRPAPTPPVAPMVAKPTPPPAAPEPSHSTTAKAAAARERPAPQPRTATRPAAPAPRTSTSTPPEVAHARPAARTRPQSAPSDLPPIELTARSQSTPAAPSKPSAPPINLVSRSEPAPVTVSAPPPTASARPASRRRNPEPPAAPQARATDPVSQFKEDAGRAANDIRHQAEAVGNWFSDTGKQIQRGLDSADRTIGTWTGTCSAANGCNQGGRVERRDRWTTPHSAETPSRYQRSAPDDDEGGYAAPPPRQAQY